VGVTKDLSMARGSQVVSDSLDSLAQLKKTNKTMNSLLDMLVGWVNNDPASVKALSKQHELGGIGAKKSQNAVSFKDPKELIISVCREIRSQVDLSLKIYSVLHDHKAVEEFQAAVLTVIAEVDPNVQKRIIQLLKERGSIQPTSRLIK